MNLLEIISELTSGEILAAGGGMVAIILTLLQVSKININPWSWLARKLGRAINGEVIEKVEQLRADLNSLRTESEEREAITCRSRILHFGDEILHGKEHTKEHFDQILADVDYYEKYCDENRDFKNSIAVATIERIRAVYQKCIKENSFL